MFATVRVKDDPSFDQARTNDDSSIALVGPTDYSDSISGTKNRKSHGEGNEEVCDSNPFIFIYNHEMDDIEACAMMDGTRVIILFINVDILND